MFHSRIPVCSFPCLLSPPFLISSCQDCQFQATPRTEITEMRCLNRISFISFSIWWKGFFPPSFDMDCLLALWLLLLLVSLVTCKVWSFDLYLKKLPCDMVYILTQNSTKYPCSTRDLGPRILLSLSLSLSLADSLERGGVMYNRGILASFLLSFSYHRLWTSRFRCIKGPQQWTTTKVPLKLLLTFFH